MTNGELDQALDGYVTKTTLTAALSGYVTTAAFDAYNTPFIAYVDMSTNAAGLSTCTATESDPIQAITVINCNAEQLIAACPSGYFVSQMLCSQISNPVVSQGAVAAQAVCRYEPFANVARIERMYFTCARAGPLSPSAARIAGDLDIASMALNP